MFYRIVKIISWIAFHIYFRVKIEGKENIPKEGGAILCPNHISMVDPVFYIMLSKRKIHFMAKKEIYSSKIMGKLLDWCGAYPIDREKADMDAYRKTISYLNSGEIVGIFAQGHRVKEGEAKAAKAGIALFATKTKCPVVPVGMVATYKPFSKVIIRFGKPVDLSEHSGKKLSSDKLNEIATEIMDQVHELRKQ